MFANDTIITVSVEIPEEELEQPYAEAGLRNAQLDWDQVVEHESVLNTNILLF